MCFLQEGKSRLGLACLVIMYTTLLRTSLAIEELKDRKYKKKKKHLGTNDAEF